MAQRRGTSRADQRRRDSATNMTSSGGVESTKPKTTGSHHVLPFLELSPATFERLCLWLARAEGFENAEHYGSGGADQGRDVVAFKLVGGQTERWYFQCKRSATIRSTQLKAEIDKIRSLTVEPAATGIIFVIAGTMSARQRDAVGNYARALGLACSFWARTELDARVKAHQELLIEFFQIGPPHPEAVASLAISSPASRAAGTPSPVVSLLDDAKEHQRRGAYAAAANLTQKALDLALTAQAGSDEGARELARARFGHSHALLLCDHSFEMAWELAEAGADPDALDGYPDLLFSALANKAESAMATGRMKIALGAVLAAEQLAQDEDDRRAIVQLRAQIALRSGSMAEAVALFEEAERSFLALLNGDRDAASRIRAKVGVGSCLANKALAFRGAGDITAAKTAFACAADWYSQGGSPYDESVARRFLARCHFDEQDWEEGFAVLDEAQRLAEQENLTSGVVACLDLRARALATTDQPDLASAALLRAVEVLGDQEPDETRRFHQMLATLAGQIGDKGAARRHLDTARVMAEQAGDPLTIADVVHQTEELAERWKRAHAPAPDDVISALRRRLEQTENPGEAAHTMQQLAGAYRSHGDLRRARDWYQRVLDAATAIGHDALAASALIGLAEVAMAEDDDDVPAAEHLRKALGLVDRLPAWDVKASGLYYMGQLQARTGDFRAARETLDKAHTIATHHHIDDLAADVDRLRDEIEVWLRDRALPSSDLVALAEQLARLEDWYPEARRRLRRLWWYWQGDEVMRNLISHSGARSLIVTDNAAEIDHLADDLAVLFDVATFVTESSFAHGEVVQTFVPFPNDLAFPYMNVLAVKRSEEL